MIPSLGERVVLIESILKECMSKFLMTVGIQNFRKRTHLIYLASLSLNETPSLFNYVNFNPLNTIQVLDLDLEIRSMRYRGLKLYNAHFTLFSTIFQYAWVCHQV